MSFITAFTISDVLVLLITFAFVLYLYFKWSWTYWSRRGVTAPPCSFPLGNLKDVVLGHLSFQEMFKNVYCDLKQKGMKYSGYYFLHKPIFVVIDTELIKSIMVKDFSHFTDHGIGDKQDYDPFGNNLFSLKGAEWKAMREKLTPLFTSGKLKLMFSTIKACSIQLRDLIDQAAENVEKLDIKDVAGRYTTDIIASVAFGIESSSLKNPHSDFRKYSERAVEQKNFWSKLRLGLQTVMPDLVRFFKITVFPADVSTFFRGIVESTIKYREENNVVRKDFMQLMIQLKNKVDISDKSDDCFNLLVNNNTNFENKKNLSSFSIEEITAQTMLFFFAGYDTSSITIEFCMYELANNQEIQDKLRNEIQTVLSQHEGKLSYNAIMELTYMEKCIKETLRKYAIISSLFRRCIKTYQVPNSNLIIEKDMIVFIPANELHYDSEYYPNPEKFDPERFSSENIAARNSYTWLPFGEGPRVCIGARLAMIQIKVALVTLLNHFQYSLDSKTPYPLDRMPRSFFVAANGGIWLNVTKITK